MQVEPFTVNIRAATCPPDPKDRVQTVIIRPSDFLKDKLNITVEIICDCDCQIPPDVTPVSCRLRDKLNVTVEILCFCSPFSSKFAVCGHGLVTLSLTINETLKWLSSLPILMRESFWW